MGQTSFCWWAVVVCVVGIALIGHAIKLVQDRRLARGTAGINPKEYRPEKAPIFGLPPIVATAGFGALVLAITTVILLTLGPAATTTTLLWTVTVVAVAIAMFYQRVYHYLSVGRITALLFLRYLSAALLLLLLFQPVIAFVEGAGPLSKIAIVIDASKSMSVADAANEPNRYRQSVLAAQTIAARLDDKFNIQCFAYDDKHQDPLPSVDAYDTISPDGMITDLSVAFGLGINNGAAQIVLFSDGIHNGPRAVKTGLENVSVPIHTVRVGNDAVEPSSVPDIAVTAVDGPQTATVNNQTLLTASIKSTAMSDRTIKVQLLQDKVQEQEARLVLHSGPTPQTVQFKFTPTKVGRTVIRVQVPVDPAERSDANNQLDFPMLVTDPKLPVLYIEGRVRPEVGPLRRALEQDPNLSAISMVQTTAGRFELRGVKEGDNVTGIPTSLQGWKRFKVIILGDLDASFLSTSQQDDLRQTVREGAGLLMIGGQRTFAPGGWNKTALADILPVNLDPVDPPQINAGFVPQLTAVGVTHPIFRNIASYFIGPAGAVAAQQMPQLSGCVALGAAKAGANVLAVHPTALVGGKPAIVLALEQYGQGRSAAFAADTTWRWSLFLRGSGRDSPYNRFWGQMVRWLASREEMEKKSGPSVQALIAKERYESGEPVQVRCAVTDNQGQATAYANVWADVKLPDGKTDHLPMAAAPDQIGVYQAVYQPQLAGKFHISFGAEKDDVDLGKDISDFSTMQAAGEMDKLAADPGTMREIAETTGGSATELSGVSALIDRLAASAPQNATGKQHRYRLYHNPSFFMAFIVALSAEWFLRRKWQLQ
jgi:uncharacterized membrane protein